MTVKKRPEREGIMLAHPLSSRRLSQLTDPFIIQPKLNGERCWVEWFNNATPVLVSSYGNEFKLPHISDALLSLNLEGWRLDGELYIHGEPFETIHSIASASRKELHPRSKEMQFYIFDYKSTDAQIHRLVDLRELHIGPPLHLVPALAVHPDAWQPHLISWVKEGYEGIMFREPTAPYIEARTPHLLKYKPTHLDEYTIVGVKEGEGWTTGMLGSFLVQGDDNTTFSVGSGALLTKQNRQSLWDRREELIGKILVVKHEAITTTGGIPKCAVALSLKEDEI